MCRLEAASPVRPDAFLALGSTIVPQVRRTVLTRGHTLRAVFWEEGGSQPFNQKITITRPIEASLPAFLRHCEDLLEHYSRFHILNLLANKEGEAALTQAYEAHLRAAQDADENVRDNVGMTEFDFHARSKGGGGIDSVQAQLWREVESTEETIGACVVGVDQSGDATQIMSQNGVFRTNCKGTCPRLGTPSWRRFFSTHPDTLVVTDVCLSHGILDANNIFRLTKLSCPRSAVSGPHERRRRLVVALRPRRLSPQHQTGLARRHGIRYAVGIPSNLVG